MISLSETGKKEKNSSPSNGHSIFSRLLQPQIAPHARHITQQFHVQQSLESSENMASAAQETQLRTPRPEWNAQIGGRRQSAVSPPHWLSRKIELPHCTSQERLNAHPSPAARLNNYIFTRHLPTALQVVLVRIHTDPLSFTACCKCVLAKGYLRKTPHHKQRNTRSSFTE